ncbi:CBS domain-containing protein [Frankia sp. Mgl5]|uniref:CBS domain-containing protein n=1 Tax=Frankia sp. Mgl5 TaxID=2933793 RepID=UPI00200CA6AD|nr:CBS domain-containing protein [Frankia sp. Mgl5]MCK9925959.1 CBS domain-containing protein [Frankia sp. Mgl5]
MTRKLSIVTPDVPVKDVARLLALRGVGAAPVVSPQGELVGIVTEADFIALEARPDSRLHARRDRSPRPAAPGTVGEVMSSPVVTAGVDADIADIVGVMLAEHISRVPILDEAGKLVGIISRSDLLRLLARPDRLVAEDVRGAVEAAGVRGSPRIEVLHGRVRISDVDTSDPALLRRLVRDVPGVLGLEIAQPVGVAGASGREDEL